MDQEAFDMITNPSSSPDDDPVLPPRHRPNLEKIVKDSAELDLWALDDLDEIPEKPKAPATKGRLTGIPAPRNRDKIKTQELTESQPQKNVSGESPVQVNVGNKPKVPMQASTPQSTPGEEFAELDHWEESELPVSRPEDYVPLQPTGISVAEMPVSPKSEPPPVAETKVEPTPSAAPPSAEDDEFSPAPRLDAVPISLRPHLKLSKIERLGLLGLVAFLGIGGLVVIIYSITRLPTSSSLVKTHDFPIQGKLITLDAADTYWREPITGGSQAETVRRGTKLIPVAKLKVSGKTAAVRVFFRNGNRELIGDAVTRPVEPGSSIEVASTAGFDDVGMHAAYRTGQTLPWTIEISEGSSATSPSSEFSRICEMQISTERR